MRTPLVLLLLLAGACTHSEPFTAPDVGVDGPLVPGVPLRLTYADDDPSAPVWTLDGDSVLYSYTRRGGGFLISGERCLAVLAAGGGTIGREICSRTVFPTQSDDAFDLPALSPGGQLAWLHNGQPVAPGATQALLVAPFASPSEYSVVRSVPVQADVFYVAFTSLGWLGDARVVFIGIAEETHVPCTGCDAIVVSYGRSVLIADPAAPGVVSVVPGTLFATSVSAGESPDIIYYTLANDSRILRQVLSTGAVTVAHDFGAPAIARDVNWAAGRLVAIVDGSVPVYADDIGIIQGANLGGTPYVVVPGAQAQAVTTAQPMWFRRPALSPDGENIVAEGAPLQIIQIGDGAGGIIGYDTIPGPSSIWRLPAP